VDTDEVRLNDYDSLAEAYAAENETSLTNAYHERPATLALAGDVDGRRILDAGCGSGALFAALRDRGAIVTGVDSSIGLLEVARGRLGTDADLQLADLTRPLPFADATFDDVIASLVMHYLRDWDPTLRELRRILMPGGRLIMSIYHPTTAYCIERLGGRRPNYFAPYSWIEEWTMGGQTQAMEFWMPPLHAMSDAFTVAGFRISVISEPQPVPEAADLYPEDYRSLTTAPGLLFFVLTAA
jgi:SAM-dependent methyltransferase